MFLPEKNIALFLAVGIAIGVVLGGTQALSRSFFSLLIPRGREGEYFALYNAFERGTSWFGVLLFGVMFQVTDSYRPAIVVADRLLRPRARSSCSGSTPPGASARPATRCPAASDPTGPAARCLVRTARTAGTP